MTFQHVYGTAIEQPHTQEHFSSSQQGEQKIKVLKKRQRSSRGDSQLALLLSALLIPTVPSVAFKTLTSLLEPSQLYPTKEMCLGIENSVSSWLLLP